MSKKLTLLFVGEGIAVAGDASTSKEQAAIATGLDPAKLNEPPTPTQVHVIEGAAPEVPAPPPAPASGLTEDKPFQRSFARAKPQFAPTPLLGTRRASRMRMTTAGGEAPASSSPLPGPSPRLERK